MLPLGLCVCYSLCDYSQPQPPLFIGLDNFRELLHDRAFPAVDPQHVLLRAMALPAGMLVSLGLALMLNANVRGHAHSIGR